MIKNEREYRITKTRAKEFERTLDTLNVAPPDTAIHPLLQKAELDALRSQLEDLREQLRAYEALKAGERHVLTATSFEQLPTTLIQSRIAAGLTQKELGEKLGLKEQQIQRYEATAYAGASLTRINEIIKALNLRIHEDVYLSTKPTSIEALFSRTNELGLDRQFLLSRVFSPQTSQLLEHAATYAEDETSVVANAAATLDRVLNLTPGAFLAANVPVPSFGAPSFKLPARVGKGLPAYTAYAYHLAKTVLGAWHAPQPAPPTDAGDLRKDIIGKYGELSLKSTLQYVWDLGIPVIPLGDSGTFHGACWRENFRHVIVLKQRTPSLARWLHDLLHELRHTMQNPTRPDSVVVEVGESPLDRSRTPDEEDASEFASAVILDGKQEALAEEVVSEAKGRIEYLKRAVPTVAVRNGIDTGALANYLAFRLALQGENWWGTATNLQARNEDSWAITRDIFCERMKFEKVSELDRQLLKQALRS